MGVEALEGGVGGNGSGERKRSLERDSIPWAGDKQENKWYTQRAGEKLIGKR